MSETGFTKKDWVLFRFKITDWQEAYIDCLNKEYIALLSDDTVSPSEKFWQLQKRIQADRKSAGVQLELSKSRFLSNLVALIREGVIDSADLDDFSEDLRNTIERLCRQ